MRPNTTLADAKKALAYLTGQTAAPPDQSEQWEFFIKSGVERLYRSFDFDNATITVDLTADDDGIIDLSEYTFAVVPAFEFVGSTELGDTYTGISAAESNLYTQGSKRYWTSLTEDGEWELHTTEPGATLQLVMYTAPVINDTNQGAYFTAMVVARAALPYLRAADDPEADTSVEEDQLRQEVTEIVEAQNRRRPQQFARTVRDITGHHLGRTGRGLGSRYNNRGNY